MKTACLLVMCRVVVDFGVQVPQRFRLSFPQSSVDKLIDSRVFTQVPVFVCF